MRTLKKAKVAGRRVLVRVDYNSLPIRQSEPRIDKSIPTLKYLLSKKASVILLTHLESNDGKTPSTKILLGYLRKKYFKNIKFNSLDLKPGEISLMENIRFDKREKKADMKFAQELAEMGDVYVNEAFSASHREHTSIVLLPKILPSYIGLHFEEEIRNLSKAFNPPHPFTIILGGGKIETKLPMLKSLLPKIDYALMGGKVLNDFVFGEYPLKSKKIILPKDVVIVGKKVFDVGSGSFDEWAGILKRSKLVVWNGPLGFMEKGYTEGTKKLITILYKTKAHVIIGGGDTLEYLPSGVPKNIFISTGGGAMLDYLSLKTLPGVKALS